MIDDEDMGISENGHIVLKKINCVSGSFHSFVSVGEQEWIYKRDCKEVWIRSNARCINCGMVATSEVRFR